MAVFALCATPAGPGFSGGVIWTLPLNAPYESAPQTAYGAFYNPVIANFTGGSDPGQQAMMIDFASASAPAKLNLIAQSGTLTTINAPTATEVNADYQLVAEDLAGDGNLEIFSYGVDYTNLVAQLSALRPDGTQISSNFPIAVPFNNPDGRLNRNPVLVGDIDGDGKKEIVATGNYTPDTFAMYLFANDGTSMLWSAPSPLGGTPIVMAATDLDNNGRLETIVAGNTATQTFLHVLQPDGSERTGWPLILPNTSVASEGYLAVGDLNVDGNKEIVFAHEGYLYVFKADGTNFSSAWPLNAGTAPQSASGYSAVTIGDVDGDGFPEIVTVLSTLQTNTDPYFALQPYENEQLEAIRRDGTVSKSWQLNAGNGCWLQFYPAPAIGDFNQDGITDIAVTLPLSGGHCASSTASSVTVLSTGGAFNAGLNDWPLTRHDPRQTSVLRCSDFCLDASAGQTVNAGDSATYALTIEPNEIPYSTEITGWACTGLPTGATCSFNVAGITPNVAQASVMVTIQTTARTTANSLTAGAAASASGKPEAGPTRATSAALRSFGVLGLAGILLMPRKRKFADAAWFALLVGATVCFASCGGSSGGGGSHTNPNGTPAGTYNVTVSAVGGSMLAKTTTVILVVN
jgi:hypothetical protein